MISDLACFAEREHRPPWQADTSSCNTRAYCLSPTRDGLVPRCDLSPWFCLKKSTPSRPPGGFRQQYTTKILLGLPTAPLDHCVHGSVLQVTGHFQTQARMAEKLEFVSKHSSVDAAGLSWAQSSLSGVEQICQHSRNEHRAKGAPGGTQLLARIPGLWSSPSSPFRRMPARQLLCRPCQASRPVLTPACLLCCADSGHRLWQLWCGQVDEEQDHQ